MIYNFSCFRVKTIFVLNLNFKMLLKKKILIMNLIFSNIYKKIYEELLTIILNFNAQNFKCLSIISTFLNILKLTSCLKIANNTDKEL